MNKQQIEDLVGKGFTKEQIAAEAQAGGCFTIITMRTLNDTVYIDCPPAFYHRKLGTVIAINPKKLPNGHAYQVSFDDPCSPLWFSAKQLSEQEITAPTMASIMPTAEPEVVEVDVEVVTEPPATEPQLKYLTALNAWHEPSITKAAASRLIDEARVLIVSPTLYYIKPIIAICEQCREESPVEKMVHGHGGYDWDNPDDDFQGSVRLMSYCCASSSECGKNRTARAEAALIEAEADHYSRYDDRSLGQIGGAMCLMLNT